MLARTIRSDTRAFELTSATFRRVRLRWLVAALIPAAVWAAGANIPVLRQGILFLAPLVLLLFLWAAGISPDPIVERLVGVRKRRRPSSAQGRCGEGVEQLLVRGGLLLAASLAGRAPPRSMGAAAN